MKRMAFLATMFIVMLDTGVVFAQTDADNFYKSNSVNMEKVSCHNRRSPDGSC